MENATSQQDYGIHPHTSCLGYSVALYLSRMSHPKPQRFFLRVLVLVIYYKVTIQVKWLVTAHILPAFYQLALPIYTPMMDQSCLVGVLSNVASGFPALGPVHFMYIRGEMSQHVQFFGKKCQFFYYLFGGGN